MGKTMISGGALGRGRREFERCDLTRRRGDAEEDAEKKKKVKVKG
jgi:hypothetical protein